MDVNIDSSLPEHVNVRNSEREDAFSPLSRIQHFSTLCGVVTRCHSLATMQVVTQCFGVPEQSLWFYYYQITGFLL